MSQTPEPFRTALRGYDTDEVDHRVEELSAAVSALTRERDALAQERDALAARVRELHATPAQTPGFAHLGERVGQILALAEAEAAELRTRAEKDAETSRTTAEGDATRLREEAEHFAEGTVSDARVESGRIVEEARKAADEHREDAERAASARLQEAEAVYEDQRARAASAAADFETTLAGRRQSAEDEFTQKMAASQARLDQANQLVETTIRHAENKHDEASRQIAQTVAAAQEKAGKIISEAKATAARIRSDSQRELAAATQRRDSINAQLANVRQMLSTLTSTVPISLAGLPVETLNDRAAGDEADESDPERTEPQTGPRAVVQPERQPEPESESPSPARRQTAAQSQR